MTKLNLIFASLIIGLGFSACAHKQPTTTPVETGIAQADLKKGNYAYGGRCAASVKENRFDVQGDPKYNLEHNGRLYCFSSPEARDDFKKDTVKNIESANRHWKLHAERIR